MVEDIGIAENIFGPDVSTLKGRITIKRPKVFIDVLFIYQENLLGIIMC